MATNPYDLDASSDNQCLIKEKSSGTYINLTSTYYNVVAYLYDRDDTLIQKWSYLAQSGYKSIYSVDSTTMEFYIRREDVKDRQGETVRLEVKTVKSTAGRGLTSDREHLLASKILQVSDSKTEDAA